MRIDIMKGLVIIWAVVVILAVCTDIYINYSINQLVIESRKEMQLDEQRYLEQLRKLGAPYQP